jgi:NAD(P)-dependent dehydrogenase (short-subunit alcohol dehydrogenase family)
MDYAKLLAGKRAFITTGSQGIGKAIAVLFAQQGAVVAVGGRNRWKLPGTVEEIRKYSPRSKGYLCDLGIRGQVEKTCDQILEDFRGIDILVSTVGINNCRGPVHEYDEDTLQRLIETNYKSGLRCMKKFVPGMLERREGNIIHISSIHGVQTMPGFGLYGGTKGAVNATARAAALDYARKGVRVNVVCPGLILSDNMMQEIEQYPKGEKRDAFLSLLDSMQPLPPGHVEDIATAALFLASDMSAYMTGQCLMVDGGASIKAH